MAGEVTPQPASGWLIYRRLLRYAFVYWPVLVVAMLAMVIMALTEAGFAALMKPLMDQSFGAPAAETADLARAVAGDRRPSGALDTAAAGRLVHGARHDRVWRALHPALRRAAGGQAAARRTLRSLAEHAGAAVPDPEQWRAGVAAHVQRRAGGQCGDRWLQCAGAAIR
jgi:ABC-type multidrug transport system fused ATPase/permease subunit